MKRGGLRARILCAGGSRARTELASSNCVHAFFDTVAQLFVYANNPATYMRTELMQWEDKLKHVRSTCVYIYIYTTHTNCGVGPHRCEPRRAVHIRIYTIRAIPWQGVRAHASSRLWAPRSRGGHVSSRVCIHIYIYIRNDGPGLMTTGNV